MQRNPYPINTTVDDIDWSPTISLATDTARMESAKTEQPEKALGMLANPADIHKTTTSVPLQDWIQLAAASIQSQERWLEISVGVALELCLSLIVAASKGESASYSEHEKLGDVGRPSMMRPLERNHVVSKNVMVHVDCSDGSAMVKNYASVRSVDLQAPPLGNLDGNAHGAPQPSSREICAAFGAILFELFSKGQELFLIDLVPNALESDRGSPSLEALLVDKLVENGSSLGGNELGGNNGGTCQYEEINSSTDGDRDTLLGPAAKRPSTECPGASHSKPIAAKHFLQQQCGLPISICRLVSDLLEAGEGQFRADSAITSLDEAGTDLVQMNTHPKRFLHDRLCPNKAREDTAIFLNSVDEDLYGRELELSELRNAAERIENHPSPHQFHCEMAFISGRSGSGKSALVKKLVSSCNATRWFVLTCKFDPQVASVETMGRMFNKFFTRFLLMDLSEKDLFDRISQSIVHGLDPEGFGQLCALVPVFQQLFPWSSRYAEQNNIASSNVGSGRNRLHALLQLLFKSILCGGHPTLVVIDDLQWSDGLALDVITEAVQTKVFQSQFAALGSASSLWKENGLFVVGAYREVSDNLMAQIQGIESSAQNVKVNQISIGELSTNDINKMLSYKLGLPTRFTQQLSEIFFHKTRGHSLFVIEFLRSIISRGVLSFSVRYRQWMWDDLVIEMLAISNDVAEFLADGLNRLDKDVVGALQVCSCLGFQVDVSTLELLDLGQFVPNLINSLDMAIKEGIMERAGPIYAFTHDMLKESSYKLIPEGEKECIHRDIALSLAQDIDALKNGDICTIAADQINLCRKKLDPIHRANFARINLSAGKHSLASSSYSQARGYFEAGIDLLHAQHWQRQYSLSLDLYESSLFSSFMDGNVENVSNRLESILFNANTYLDTLNARELNLKVMACKGEHSKSTAECLSILEQLGVYFPDEIDPSFVTSQITETDALLNNDSRYQLLGLSRMTDPTKLHVMRFLNALTTFSMFARLDLCHLASCMMVKFTLNWGFCEESIHGLATFSRAVLLQKDDIEKAFQLGLLAESLMKKHSNKRALRARFAVVVQGGVYAYKYPWHSLPEQVDRASKDGMLVGDVENSMICGHILCIVRLHVGSDLSTLQGTASNYLGQMTRKGMLNTTFNGIMSIVCTCAILSGSNAIGVKTNEELAKLAKDTRNFYLLHHVNINLMLLHFYQREYTSVLQLVNEHNLGETKRVGDFFCVLYVGISALCLARDTRQVKWRGLGEKSITIISQLALQSKWNFDNKFHLLQAELHYINGDLKSAENSYKRSIATASKHKFVHEQALALELHSLFLTENREIDRGLEQMNASILWYSKWGAHKKVKQLSSFIQLVRQARPRLVHKDEL